MRNSPVQLLLFFIITYTVGSRAISVVTTEPCDCLPIPKDFNTTISSYVDNACRRCYHFTYDFQRDQTWAANVCIKSQQSTQQSPLLITVMESISNMALQLPVVFEDANSVPTTTVCHTLCPLANYFESNVTEGPQTIKVELATSSSQSLHFELIVSTVNDFVIGEDEPLNVTITPSEPRVLQYNMKAGVQAVRVEANSKDYSCMILAIQEIQCPFYDSERTIEHKGFFQTLTRQSGISVTRKTFYEGSFYIVLILLPSDASCTEEKSSSFMKVRQKEVTVQVVPSITVIEFYEAVLGSFVFYILFYVIAFIVCCVYCVRNRRHSDESQTVDVESPSIQSYGTSSASCVEDYDQQYRTHELRRTESPVSLDETDIDKLPDAEVDKNVVRAKPVLFVSDLCKTKEKYLRERTKVYSWNLLTIAIFYGLPVVQLVYINQKIVNMTGNQDLCYYNFLCSHKLWVFSDFNHVYSNIGYVMLGILFLLLVWRRETMFKPIAKRYAKIPNAQLKGIPQHFGLMYAMGWALIMEGVLSASYHVCPNKTNFQFDTAFMYVIATVSMLKLYHARHPDITAKSHTTWMVLAIIIIIGVGGVLNGGLFFWLLFIFVHLIVTFLVSSTIYYMGRWKIDRWVFKRIHHNLKLDIAAHSYRPMHLGRFFSLLIAVLLNFALDIYGLVKRPDNFAAFLLAAFIMNLLLYLLYYTFMKIRYREKIGWVPIMYMVLSFACWIAALHYFLAKNTSWKVTPAESRERNKHCIILNFFDDHDIWHYLSSCALFFSFMVMFTLDDDLETTPRSKIIVF